jgi:HNH endonuclease
MNPFYPAVAARALNQCEYCHAPEVSGNFPFEVEHIVPTAAGGVTAIENLALACRSYNIFKSCFLTGIDGVGNEISRLFHPRHDSWTDHFIVDLQTLNIGGLTEIGQGRVNRLRINNPLKIGARSQWIRLDLFP